MTTILQIIVALSFVLYLSYIRLFRKMHDIPFSSEIFQEYFYIFLFMFIVSFGLTCLLFFSLFWGAKQPLTYNQKVKNITAYLTRLTEFLNTSLLALYVKIFNFVGPILQQYLVLFAKNFLENKQIRRALYWVMLLPRILICIIFLIEIYLGHLKYYYYSLFLLILPLLVQFLVFILKDIGPRLYPVFSEYLIFTKVATAPGDFFFY